MPSNHECAIETLLFIYGRCFHGYKMLLSIYVRRFHGCETLLSIYGIQSIYGIHFHPQMEMLPPKRVIEHILAPECAARDTSKDASVGKMLFYCHFSCMLQQDEHKQVTLCAYMAVRYFDLYTGVLLWL